MKLTVFSLLMLGVLLNAAAQLLIKAGMTRIGEFDFQLSNVLPIGLQIAGNLPILLGLSAYVVSVLVWMMVLSRVDVSLAYPMVSLGYVINAIAAFYLFAEPLSALRIGGIFIILMGVFMVARS
jgi:multidrug transporter EmrE-like cation transporter